MQPTMCASMPSPVWTLSASQCACEDIRTIDQFLSFHTLLQVLPRVLSDVVVGCKDEIAQHYLLDSIIQVRSVPCRAHQPSQRNMRRLA